jgi:transcriptional regulator with GAF, ATPase, and Fis domain
MAEPRIPSETDLQLIEGAGHTAVIATEGERSQVALTRAFDEIAKSEAELRTTVDATPQLIVAIGTDGNILYANQAGVEYSGITLAEVDSERSRAEAHRRMLGDGGAFKFMHCVGHPVLNQNGDLVEFVGAVIDTTEQVQARFALENALTEVKLLRGQLDRENLALRDEVDCVSMFEELLGSSRALQAVVSRVVKVAPTDCSVLITGETGTGKELIARAIHKRSARSQRAFVSVNCAALASSLISCELFGHEKGAFTGAIQRRLGRFELANGGTIFLDEVGELPAENQVALLRVLQEREFERVGGTQSIQVDVRVVAATNRDLEAAIANGTFREDLFYRLNVFPIQVPPLRARKDDILTLLEYFVQRFSRKLGKTFSNIDKRTVELFRSYDWPGNVRELQNIVERSVIVSPDDVFCVDEAWLSTGAAKTRSTQRVFEPTSDDSDCERELIEAALAESAGRVYGTNGAAAKLGIPPSTLDSKIMRLQIRKSHFKPY